ncbi:hypothetical protein ACFQ9V_17595 [Leifsonia sp. NPDC056665]|uniref:hypothetical protein n=1 Tax=Leifsonia sp. NPDC056665 TaxID=3345901 RepID=UPI00369F36E2
MTGDEHELDVLAAQNVHVVIRGASATVTTIGVPRGIGSRLREHILQARGLALHQLRNQGFQIVDTDRFDDTQDSSCFMIWDNLTT